jgi:hypothetical protein
MENPVPRLELNSKPLPSRNSSLRNSKIFSNAPYFDWDKLPRYQDFKSLGNLLRKCMSEEAGTASDNNYKGGFLPPAILDRILSREAVEYELKRKKNSHDTARTLDIMFRAAEEEVDESTEFPGEKKTYFTVFAILALMDKACDISRFLEDEDRGLCDQDLPNLKLHQDEDGSCELRRAEESQQVPCFDGWGQYELEYFDTYQWRLRVPTFALDPDKKIRHYELHDKDILPWCEEHSMSDLEVMSGGYGSVKKVKIHPLCHDYHDTLKAVRMLRPLERHNQTIAKTKLFPLDKCFWRTFRREDSENFRRS